jgi:predicted nuclease of restriction endonuclease-like RecB superfamily
MLSADLVPVRRKNGELLLTAITGKTRQHHVELAEQVMALVLDCEGMTREQLLADVTAVGQSPTESRIVKGYAKLLEDALEFEADRGRGAAAIREAVFDRAALAWQGLRDGESFDRNQVLAEVAPTFEREPTQLEEELFIDLPGAQRVIKAVSWSAEELVERYDQGRILAVLLRAVSIKASFRVRSVMDVRALFKVLKFRRLLFTLERRRDAAYELTISGPYSLFDAVTKYGLQLALCWPSLAAQSDLTVEAELRWGKKNEKLRFCYSAKAAEKSRSKSERAPLEAEGPVELGDDSEQLRQELERAMPGVSVTAADQMLELPGIGLVVPDLVCHFDDGTEVFVEVLGFWSREAVWRRVELVEAGLVAPILFVVSSRLRVSEEVLDEKSNAALYVYRGRINATSAAGKISELACRQRKPTPLRAKRR